MAGFENFEWLYFDVHQADGFDFVFALHTKPFMSHFDVSIFDVFVYRKNQRLVHKFLVIPNDRLQTTSDGNRIQYQGESSLFFERNSRYVKLTVRADWLDLELVLNNNLPEREPLKVHFPSTNEALQSFRWVLFMPQAQASGQLRIKDDSGHWLKAEISGRGYHDANKGALNLKKELKSWLWMKIYHNETMWIAGKIIPRMDEPKQILVRVRPQQLDFTVQAHIKLDENRLQLESPLGKVTFHLSEKRLLDDLRFLVPVWPRMLVPLEKVREILAAFTLERKALRPLRELLTNGKYRRYRWLAQDTNGQKVEIFGEEMILND